MKIISDISHASTANFITHSGIFHADEIFATAILSTLFGDITVLRLNRLPKDVNPNAIIYDIGFGKFDHHQKNGNGVRENGIPYATCGLIWKEFGPQIVKGCDDPEFVRRTIDRQLVQGIDASDTKFFANSTDMSKIISSFNPSWDSEKSSDEAFGEAVEYAKIALKHLLEKTFSKVRARANVEKAISNSKDGIMILERYSPWSESLFNSTNEKAKDILFVVYPSNRNGFNWQAVPDTTSYRKTVPDNWKGLSDSKIREVTGIATATFCHDSGFIGGAETFEDIIKFVKLAINS